MRASTIYEFEQIFWGDPAPDATYLVETCHRLRRKPLNTFNIEDYRILIGQGIALNLLIPSALEILKTNIAAEGDLYEGDLLASVLSSEKAFWQDHLEMKQNLILTVRENMNELIDREIMDRQMKKAFDKFQSE